MAKKTIQAEAYNYNISGHGGIDFNEKERREISILLVDPDNAIRSSIRQALVSVGYDEIMEASDQKIALEKLGDRHYSHIIFDARGVEPGGKEFVRAVLSQFPQMIMLPSSYEPTVDDVFELLIAGAKGYIVKPITAGSLDESITWATKGDPITEAIRHTSGRNEALAAVILSALDRLALVLQQSRKFETARLEIPRKVANLERAVEVARTFAKGGAPRLREAIVEFAIQRSENSDARLTNVKKRSALKKRPKTGNLKGPILD